MPHEHELKGLRDRPLASYLAALGLLRLVSEQVDHRAQAYWRHGYLRLRTALDAEALELFLQRDYQPTPMASPWNKGGGFYNDEDAGPRLALLSSGQARFASYAETIKLIERILAQRRLTTAPTGREKAALIEDLHAALPPPATRWLRAVVPLVDGQPRYSPLFLTGGNDQKLDFARQVMARLELLFLQPRTDPSRVLSWLRSMLWDNFTEKLPVLSSGLFDPFSGLMLDSKHGKEMSNPWTFLLAMEGALSLSGGLDLRPPEAMADGSVVRCEQERPELWLPLWREPLTLPQLERRWSGEEGFPAHIRYALVARGGRAHFAIPGAIHRRHQPVEAEARDGSTEFRLARSLAGLRRERGEKLDVRAGLSWYRGQDVHERMLSLLRHRIRAAHQLNKRPDAKGRRKPNAPLWATRPASWRDVSAFLRGEVDEARMERLFLHLCLQPAPSRKGGTGPLEPLPLPFRLARLAFHQMGDLRLPPEAVLDGLRREEIGLAMRHARQFLLARHPDLEHPSHQLPPVERGAGRRIAAALLFPIDDAGYSELLATVTGAERWS